MKKRKRWLYHPDLVTGDNPHGAELLPWNEALKRLDANTWYLSPSDFGKNEDELKRLRLEALAEAGYPRGPGHPKKIIL